MAQETNGSSGIDLGKFNSEERLGLIRDALDFLNASELRVIRDRAERKWQEKLEEAKRAAVEKMRAELAEAGVDPRDVIVSFGRPKAESRAPIKPKYKAKLKYKGPNGEIWTGRGYAPGWLKQLEAAGHNREEFRVTEESQV